MNIPRSVWLVRHGQTDWNLAGKYQSHADRELTSFGQRQARALTAYFARRKVDAVVHTGLSRTETIARAIVGQRSTPCLCNEDWREASHGMWEGLTYAEVMQRYPEDAASRFADSLNNAPTGGESLADMSERVMTAWRRLGYAFPKQRVVVVTHATPIQVVLCMLTGVPLRDHWRWRIDLGGVTAVDCYPGATILRTVNAIPSMKA